MPRHEPGTCQAHMRCTAAIDESVHQVWRNRFVYSWVLTRSCSVSLNESSIFFVCFGRVILQNWFRNFTFEIIDYFKCRSNGSSQPHLNQMLEFLLNRPTTSYYQRCYPSNSVALSDWNTSIFISNSLFSNINATLSQLKSVSWLSVISIFMFTGIRVLARI